MSNLLFILAETSELAKNARSYLPDTFGLLAALYGVYCFMNAFVPENWRVFKTKNTVGMNKNMFLLHGVVGFLFLIGALLTFIEGVCHPVRWLNIVLGSLGVLFTANTLSSFVGCMYTLFLVVKNEKGAAKEGLTPQEYHEKHYGHLSANRGE